jgi:hypothetical protein
VSGDPLSDFGRPERAAFAAVADHLIPAAHDMPSAGEVINDTRLRFVLRSRPDLVEPLRAALRPELGEDPAQRITRLQADEPDRLAALQLAVVGGYYTDAHVRELIGYPGQEARPVDAGRYPEYLAEGLTDQVAARGPIWRDPATGRRVETS